MSQLQIQVLHASFLLSKLFVAQFPIFNFTIITVFVSSLLTLFFPLLLFPKPAFQFALRQLPLQAPGRQLFTDWPQQTTLDPVTNSTFSKSKSFLTWCTNSQRDQIYFQVSSLGQHTMQQVQHRSAIDHMQRQWDLLHNNFNQRMESMALLHMHI